VFGRLTDLLPREAWAHEALTFTPWLAANIDQLSEAVGIPLEVTGTEIPVEGFAADVLARNPSDGSVVLIENQLEQTDHTHLGQIMTYLAGLEAQTVIWVAPRFREPHLSAIRWLNQHTADGFSFFAVRLRVVRIGDSPYAPIFEVVEKPNGWDRMVTRVSMPQGEQSAISRFRRDFWTAFIERHPEDVELGIAPYALSSCWMEMAGGSVVVVSWVGNARVGVFIRGPRGSDAAPAVARLGPHADVLEKRLDARFGNSANSLLGRELRMDMSDRANWPTAIDWLHDQLHHYRVVLDEVLAGAEGNHALKSHDEIPNGGADLG
jgi:hypothetical protein